MINSLHEPITVFTLFSPPTTCNPYKILWKTRTYHIKTYAFHHKTYRGEILYHIFSLSTGTLDLKISFNTQTLVWILEEISDGNTY